MALCSFQEEYCVIDLLCNLLFLPLDSYEKKNVLPLNLPLTYSFYSITHTTHLIKKISRPYHLPIPVSQVYNGLLARPDWEEAIQFPIGIIPGGSGNGLARSVAHWLRYVCVFVCSCLIVRTNCVFTGLSQNCDVLLSNTVLSVNFVFLNVNVFGTHNVICSDLSLCLESCIFVHLS